MIGYVFGVDGGQTSTKCALVTTEGRVLAYGSGGGLIHLSAHGGEERLVVALRDAFATAFAAAGIAPQPVAAIGLGLTGAEGGTPESDTAKALVARVIEAPQVEVQSDAHAALLGAHGGRPGMIAIAGTGSHIMGIDAQGRVARAGGWGWLLGDEGSALWIGRCGLAAALHADDGVGGPTALEGLMRAHLGVASLRDIKRVVYATDFGARGFASLAPIVSRAASSGDHVAQAIIAHAANELAVRVLAVQRRLALAADVPVSPVGGAYDHVCGLRQGFERALRRQNPAARIVAPEYPPVLGAALMALHLCGGAQRIAA
jgi:N-acetylglucosamine kinase-like BadF-type ATPase